MSVWWVHLCNCKTECVTGCTTIVEMVHCHPLPRLPRYPCSLYTLLSCFSFKPSPSLQCVCVRACVYMMSLLIAQGFWVWVKLVYILLLCVASLCRRFILLFPRHFLSLAPLPSLPPSCSISIQQSGVAECGKSDSDIYGSSFGPSTADCSWVRLCFSSGNIWYELLAFKMPTHPQRKACCCTIWTHAQNASASR